MGDDATGVLRIFQWSGHTYGTGKLKVSSLRCYNLLVAGSPMVRLGLRREHARLADIEIIQQVLTPIELLYLGCFPQRSTATLAA